MAACGATRNPDDGDDDEKGNSCRVLVMGACGFIGRELVSFLTEDDDVTEIVAADKRLPAMSFFSDRPKAAFKDKKVKFVHSDLMKPDHLKNKIFKDGDFDYIFNLCGETRCSLPELDYENRILNVVKAAAAAAVGKCKKWIELSTGQVYKGSKVPVKENGEIEPWTRIGNYRLKAEQELQRLQKEEGLKVSILRASIVYGPGAVDGLMPRFVCAAGYKDDKQKMTFFWTKGVRINTVHVRDVCSAMWLCARTEVPQILNLSDPSDFTQLDFNKLLSKLLNMQVGFVNKATDLAVRTSLSTAAAIANDRHVPRWAKITKDHKLELNTPLSAFIDEEILKKNHYGVNGGKLSKVTGFKYQHPKPTLALFAEMLEDYQKRNFFPKFELTKK